MGYPLNVECEQDSDCPKVYGDQMCIASNDGSTKGYCSFICFRSLTVEDNGQECTSAGGICTEVGLTVTFLCEKPIPRRRTEPVVED
jgi:hypothetical protein